MGLHVIRIRTKEEAIADYDRFYEEADKLFKQYDPCEIRTNSKGITSCYQTRTAHPYSRDGSLCCGGCRHLSDKGCTVQALGCKVWICGALAYRKGFEEFREKLNELRRQAGSLTTGCRESKDEFFSARYR